jgi:hypothetical protein
MVCSLNVGNLRNTGHSTEAWLLAAKADFRSDGIELVICQIA